MLLYDYLQTHPEFAEYEVVEFCDDGFSGKRMDRPQFQEMLDGVRRGMIHCILVKDFSRFCRDYIEIGNYLEQLFPFMGTRFIAVTDHYDSKTAGTAGLEVVFQNFIADFYSRDTSKKIRSVRREMAREGKFASAYAPYGYRKDSEDKHKLLVDEEAALVVRKIFQLKLEGLSVRRITMLLNEAEIPSPAQYALQKKCGRDWRRKNNLSAWDATKVSAILKDERYAGNMVSLKRHLKGIYGTAAAQESGNWVRVAHTHEGIVSYETFLRTQETFKVYQKKQPEKSDHTNVFVCAHCGRKLSYSKNRKKLICRYGEVNPQAVCKHAVYVGEKLREAVMTALEWHLAQLLPFAELRKMWLEKEAAALDMSFYERSMGGLEKKKIRLYEQYREGVFTKEEYARRSSELCAGMETLQKKVQAIKTKRSAIENGRIQPVFFPEPVCGENGNRISAREWEQRFVEQVLVYDEGHIKIEWKFGDVFEVPAFFSPNVTPADVTERLAQVNPALAAETRKVLDVNKSERHIRGGLATKEKYLHQH